MQAVSKIDWNALPTPCYVVDERLLIRNLEILQGVKKRTGCKILLAQKGFSMFAVYPLIGEYLDGTTASSLFEAKLGYEKMGRGAKQSASQAPTKSQPRETHIFAPAFSDADFDEIVQICDHIVFNSFSQWRKFRGRVGTLNSARSGNTVANAERFEHVNQDHTEPHLDNAEIECGIRVNPEYSEIETDIYNPCFTHSRLGVTLANFEPDELEGISGLHFHTMCEQNADTLARTLDVFEEKFGQYLPQMKWVNFGGGHHITRPEYDIEILVSCISRIQEKYNVTVYLEPGEAVALNTGFLVSSVMDIIENGMQIAILDTSAVCHMPDVLEMPYRPHIIGSDMPNALSHTYRLGGPTCLAGDVIGDYSFDKPLQIGDRLVFCDMAHYSMVKNNTFNGINLPAIVLATRTGENQMIREFGYEDFKGRLS